MRRFTRLANAFSKTVENDAAAVALYFMYYNVGRIHQTFRVTPAMEAGVTITCGALRKSSVVGGAMKTRGLTAGGGMVLGMIFGIAMGHLVLGMVLGLIFGGAVAAARRSRTASRSEQA